MTPLVLVQSRSGGLRVTGLNGPAEDCGISHGQLLADARALVPDLHVRDADEAADDQALLSLSDWCHRYTPWVAPATRHNGRDGLILDITGCGHLFGGEEGLVKDLIRRLKKFRIEARIGVADTPGAAWALAHFGSKHRNWHLIGPDEQEEALANLPVEGLRIDQVLADGLRDMGLKTIGQLYDMPRAPLTERFGTDVAHRLDQALGIDEEPISPRSPMIPYRLRRVLAEPIVRQEDVLYGLEKLANDLCQRMADDQVGARKLEAELYRVDGQVMRMSVGTSSATCDVRHIIRLFAEKIDTLVQEFDAGFGVDTLSLAAPDVERVQAIQAMLSTVAEREDKAVKSKGGAKGKAYPTFSADLGYLMDRLGNRLGADRVGRLSPRESHLPEQAEAKVPVMAVQKNAERDAHSEARAHYARAGRPLSMLRAPEPVEVVAEVPEGPPRVFRWRRVSYTVTRVQGPERVAPEWWQGVDLTGGKASRTRDYYQVEDTDGRRFWLYRNGLYNREAKSPDWYIQGVFG